MALSVDPGVLMAKPVERRPCPCGGTLVWRDPSALGLGPFERARLLTDHYEYVCDVCGRVTIFTEVGFAHRA